MTQPSTDAVPVQQNTLPRLTVPQWLAFAAFLIFVALAFAVEGRITPVEFVQVRKLLVFLIAALLPSDALIRLGRSLYLRGNEQVNPKDAVTQMPMATLPQYLAFGSYLVIVVLTLVADKVVTSNEFDEINKVAVLLIGALLPSEAAIRFGRSLYLSRATTVTNSHLKMI